MFHSLVNLVSGAWWTYPLVFGVAMLDAFFPLVPAETVAITDGVLAGSGKLSLPLCIVAASAGAFGGDNISYGLGNWLGEHRQRRSRPATSPRSPGGASWQPTRWRR